MYNNRAVEVVRVLNIQACVVSYLKSYICPRVYVFPKTNSTKRQQKYYGVKLSLNFKVI